VNLKTGLISPLVLCEDENLTTMNIHSAFILYAVIIIIVLTVACKKDNEEEQTSEPQKYEVVKVETDFGNFMIWLYEETPLHKENFLNLTNTGFYDSLIFHRVVNDFVIQGGDPEGTGYGGPGYNIPAEIVAGLNHVYGAVGAARLPDNVNPEKESNGSQYYIVCDPDGESFLDGNYTVFGFVFSGMDAVFDISQVPVDSVDKPISNVYMKKLSVEKYTADQLSNNFGFDIP
jgi:cyclophilin family peptidyl-prolyl cis-trans isomerase